MRRLVEHFGGVQNIFKASLTELEATGIQTVSAQSLGTGQSMNWRMTNWDAWRRPVFPSSAWMIPPTPHS